MAATDQFAQFTYTAPNGRVLTVYADTVRVWFSITPEPGNPYGGSLGWEIPASQAVQFAASLRATMKSVWNQIP